MKHEIHRKQYFKNQLRLLAAAFVLAPAAVLALTLLCLGRGLLAQTGQTAPPLSVELPLSAPLETGETQDSQPTADQTGPGGGSDGAGGGGEAGEDTGLWDQSVTLTVQIGDTVQEMTLGTTSGGGGGGGDARQLCGGGLKRPRRRRPGPHGV